MPLEPGNIEGEEEMGALAEGETLDPTVADDDLSAYFDTAERPMEALGEEFPVGSMPLDPFADEIQLPDFEIQPPISEPLPMDNISFAQALEVEEGAASFGDEIQLPDFEVQSLSEPLPMDNISFAQALEVEDGAASFGDEIQLPDFGSDPLEPDPTPAEDEELMRLLRVDEYQSKKIDLEHKTAINRDVLVYQDIESADRATPDDDETPWVSAKKGRKKSKDIVKGYVELPFVSLARSRAIFAIVNRISIRLYVFALLGVTALMALSVLMLLRQIDSLRESSAEAAFMKDALTAKNKNTGIKSLSNDANFLFLNTEFIISGQELKLTKTLCDRSATVFYFNKPIDTNRYAFKLIDDQYREYPLDLAYFEVYESEESSRSVRFLPFEAGTVAYLLTIEDIATREEVKIAFRFSEPTSLSAFNSINEELVVYSENDCQIVVNDAYFVSSGSYVNFEVKNEGEARLTFGSDSFLSVYQIDSKLTQLRPMLVTKADEIGDKTVYRYDFAPVRNLFGNIRLSFKDVYLETPINREFDVMPLFRSTADSGERLPLPGHILALERMGVQGDSLVLVYHMEKNADGDENEEEVRVQALVDSELEITLLNGETLTIPGDCLSMPDGGDVRYKIPEGMAEEITSLPRDSFRLKLNAAAARVPDINFNVSLFTYKNQPPRTEAVSDAIVEAFKGRLLRKAGAEDGSLAGFSAKALADKSVMKNYAPLPLIDEPLVNAQVLSLALSDDGETAVAIVAESFKGVTDKNEIQYFRKHLVTASVKGEKISILKDEIIKTVY